MTTKSAQTFDAAVELMEAAFAEGRAETAMAWSRVARLRAAIEFEALGLHKRAMAIVAEVRDEQASAR